MKNVVIVAGGKGLRLGGEIPKQFLPIGGIPILMRTIKIFYQYDNSIKIIVVLPKDHFAYWKELCQQYNFTISHEIVDGGETRFHSVKNGLSLATDGLVGIHDAARPFTSIELIKRSFDSAKEHGSAIPIIDLVDSLRKIGGDGTSYIVDRSAYKMVQTPQVFDVEILKTAYQSDFDPSFTDDASVVESTGKSVYLVGGERNNIKITTSFDLVLAKTILEAE